jgi:hypothetical protein
MVAHDRNIRPSAGRSAWVRWGIAAAALAYLGFLLIGYHITGTARRHHVESAWYTCGAIAIGLALLSGGVSRRSSIVDPSRRGSRREQLMIAVAAIVASAVLYFPAVSVGLLSDDFVLLEMPFVGGWQHLRPLPLLLWSVISPAVGPAGLHLLNVVLHGVNAALVFCLSTAIVPSSGRRLGVLAAALFITSPVAVEPVTWCAGVFDVTLVTSGLAYLLVLAAGRSAGWTTLWAVTSLAIGLACKETAVALPALGFLLALRRPVSRHALMASAAVALTYGAVRAIGAPDDLLTGVSLRYGAKELLSRPFAALAEPWTSSDLGSVPLLLGVLVPLGYAVVILGHVLGRRADWRALSTGAWVVAGAVPVLAYLYVGPDLSGSRYVYLPLVGWVLLLAETAWEQGNGVARRAAVGFLACVAVAGVVGTARRLAAWTEAAALRDVVLVRAEQAIRQNGCAAAILTGAPETYDGAFVLRNGLPEAVRRSSGVTVLSAPTAEIPARCTLTWKQGEGFSPATPTAP